MKLSYLCLIGTGLLFSCNPADSPKVASDTTIVTKPVDTVSNPTHRQLLIEQLKELQQVIASKNKEKIASLFTFPIPGSALTIYIEDELFQNQFNLNGNKTTKAMFLRYFDPIATDIWVDQLNTLFQNIQVDSLAYKDSLGFKAYRKADPCFYAYQLEVLNNTVTLRMNMESNRSYLSKNPVEEDIPENSSEICEHSLWWVFEFDGAKLHFKEISGAG